MTERELSFRFLPPPADPSSFKLSEGLVLRSYLDAYYGTRENALMDYLQPISTSYCLFGFYKKHSRIYPNAKQVRRLTKFMSAKKAHRVRCLIAWNKGQHK